VGAKPNYEFYDIFHKENRVKVNLVGYFTWKKSEMEETDLELYEQE
jgi:hypothetical protein